MKNDNIVGQKIVEVRPMSDKEMEDEDWAPRHGSNPSVLVLENGVLLYPSQDEEGNGHGEIFGKDGDKCFILISQEVRK